MAALPRRRVLTEARQVAPHRLPNGSVRGADAVYHGAGER